MNELDFPKTQIEFQKIFNNEAACRNCLMKIRWKNGYRCPSCCYDKYWMLKTNLLECCSCGRQTSLTAGTVMHGTRKPLQMWFLAMWWVCTQKTGGSAKNLQRLLGLGSYQTAWSWLHKLRRAMINADREPLNGTVEIDDAFIGGKEEGVVGRETFKKAKIVVAVEIPDFTRKALGRLRIGHVRDFSEASLVSFVVDNVSYDSKVITDGWRGYNSLSELGFIHEVHSVAGGAELLENVHLSISLLKRWILGTHHGAVRPKHIQHYLDEFVFRHNRRTSKYVGKIFYRMLQGTITMKATPYWQLVGRKKSDKPLHVVYT